MKLNKIINKFKKYLKKKNLSLGKQEKIKEIIGKLSLKKAKLKQEIKSCNMKTQKEKLQKEFEGVSKLLKKSKKLIEKSIIES